MPVETGTPPDTLKTASEIAARASTITGGDRAASHGDKYENHRKIADVWNGILVCADKPTKEPLTAMDVATLMEGLKIARRYCGDFNIDDFVDGAGYAAVAGEIAAKGQKITKSWVKAIREIPVPEELRYPYNANESNP